MRFVAFFEVFVILGQIVVGTLLYVISPSTVLHHIPNVLPIVTDSDTRMFYHISGYLSIVV